MNFRYSRKAKRLVLGLFGSMILILGSAIVTTNQAGANARPIGNCTDIAPASWFHESGDGDVARYVNHYFGFNNECNAHIISHHETGRQMRRLGFIGEVGPFQIHPAHFGVRRTWRSQFADFSLEGVNGSGRAVTIHYVVDGGAWNIVSPWVHRMRESWAETNSKIRTPEDLFKLIHEDPQAGVEAGARMFTTPRRENGSNFRWDLWSTDRFLRNYAQLSRRD